MSQQPLRFGILGTGNIARQFASHLPSARRSRLVAVASRQQATADTFASTYRCPTAYCGYEALLADPQVDAVYNALPNSMHHEWTIKALRAGKHVLCEKPIASNTRQAIEMFEVSRQTGRVLMEAFMYRSHPLTLEVMNVVRAGRIGQVRLIRTSFCYYTTRLAGNIRFQPDLAGGALMDIGCYCTSFSRLFARQEPVTMLATGKLHESGVDELTAGCLRFPNGIVASFTCGMQAHTNNTAYICGTEGYVEIPVPWKPPVKQAAYAITSSVAPRMDNSAAKAPAGPPPRETHYVDSEIDLYAIEADDFAATVQDNAPLRVTPEDSVGNMRVLDELRRQMGIRID